MIGLGGGKGGGVIGLGGGSGRETILNGQSGKSLPNKQMLDSLFCPPS